MGSFLELLAQYVLDLLPWRVTMDYEWGVRSPLGRRPAKPLGTGLHIFIPGYHKYWEVPKTQQVKPLRTQSMITRNGVPVVFAGTVTIRVTDPISHLFDVHDFDSAMEDVAMGHLGERVHELEVKEGEPVDLKSLLKSLKGTLETRLRSWGTEVDGVAFPNFVPTQHQVRLFQDPLRTPETEK